MSDTQESNNTINGWLDLARIVDEYSDKKWIFRGVSDESYTLVPKIGRPSARNVNSESSNTQFDNSEEKKMLEHFKRAVKPHIHTVDVPHLSYDWELQAVGQHHGLNTRLLDWSESPFVAAYFAVENLKPIMTESKSAALYGAPCPYKIDEKTTKWPAQQNVVALYPSHLTPRITTQRGLFTVHKDPLEEWSPKDLKKWQIPSETFLEIKKKLDIVGINRASLFPDIDGIAKYINWLYKMGNI